MKRRICILLILAGLLLSAAACNGTEAPASSSPESSGVSEGTSAESSEASQNESSVPSDSDASLTEAPTQDASQSTPNTTKTNTTGRNTTVTTKTSATAVTTTTAPSVKETTAATTTAPTYNYKKYNLETFIQPIWKGDTVYNETLMFVPNAQTKEIDPAPLLYTPDKVISVRSFDLTKEYKEGVDYVVENGCIKLTAATRIPTWNYDEYYRKYADVFDLPSTSAPGRHLKYGTGATFQKTQVCVTYTHKDSWSGPVQKYQGDKLPKTMKLLQEKKSLSIVYNGNSVMAGAEASRWNKMAPFVPIWSEMVTEELKAVYGADIHDVNTAVGGTTSDWGLEKVQDNIVKYNPDLVIMHFGGNESVQGMLPSKFQSNIEGIIQAVRKGNPDCEFILVSNSLPNPDVQGWNKYHREYQETLVTIAEQTPGVALVKMTEMYDYLLTKKRYWDMTGNNINHPNDFMVRVFAQAVSQALVPTL